MPTEYLYPNSEDNLIERAKSVAHSLNNMMSIVLTNSQLAMEHINNSDNKSYKEILDCLKDIATATADSGILVHHFQKYLDSLVDEEYSQRDIEISPVLPHHQSILPHENKDKSYKSVQNIKQVSILIIDDEDKIRHALSYALTLAGHHVITASDGEEGISIFKDGSYDLVFVDLKMPDMDGWEVIKQLKYIDPDVILVIMTGWRVSLDDKRLQENEVEAVITKPFDLSEINRLLYKMLNEGI
ncbi:response regulator [Candidatus Poribacteria bacterium]|nr:response regulator [Candidatus Poribacteria bacterium]